MYVKLGETIYGLISTNAFADGSAVNADSTPTVAVYDNGSAISGGYAPTVTNITTGLYLVACVASSGNGFTAGHGYAVYGTATIGGKTTRFPVAGISSFNLTSRNPDDLAYPATSGRSLAVDASGQVTIGAYAAAAMPGGQLKPNSVIDNRVYTASGKPSTWRVRVFSTKAAADAARAAPGHADGADGEVARYKFTATWNTDDSLQAYEFAQELP